MIAKLAGLTLIIACFSGCAGDWCLEKPCDPFVGYNCSPCKLRGIACDYSTYERTCEYY